MAPSIAATFAAAALEGTLRSLLGADPATREEVRALAPARLTIDLARGPRLTLVFTDDGARVEADATGDADARITVTPAGLVDLLSGDTTRAVMSGAVRIDGDGDLVTGTFAVLSRFRPDLEGPLTRLFGETPASILGTAARTGRRGARRMAQGTAQFARDALTSADGPLPSRVEVARFMDEVDDIRLDTDRLAARVERLRSRAGEGRAPHDTDASPGAGPGETPDPRGSAAAPDASTQDDPVA